MLSDRRSIGTAISAQLRGHQDRLADEWQRATPIRHFLVDDLLPAKEALSLSQRFPNSSALFLRSSLRERKRVGADVKRYSPLIGEHLFAFQEPPVVQAIGEITGLSGLEADPTLYASGISVMGRGDFLEPHLDNSHDGDGQRYRALNILYYASPDWKPENGGNLELWNPKVTEARTILSKFNRLVVMETHRTNWHSVTPIRVNLPRFCLSNYYFSATSPTGREYRQVTTFRGRPEEPFKRLWLPLDSWIRNAGSRVIPARLRKNRHRISS